MEFYLCVNVFEFSSSFPSIISGRWFSDCQNVQNKYDELQLLCARMCLEVMYLGRYKDVDITKLVVCVMNIKRIFSGNIIKPRLSHSEQGMIS